MEFNKGSQIIDYKNVSEKMSKLYTLVEKLSGQSSEKINLRDDFLNDDINPSEIINRLNQIEENFADELKKELNSVTHDFANDQDDEKFAEFIKELAEERKNSNSNEAKEMLGSYVANLGKPKEKTETTNNISLGDNSFTLDSLIDDGLKENIENIYNVDGSNITFNGDTTSFIDSIDDLSDDLIAEQNRLELETKRQTKLIERLVADGADKSEIIEASENLKSTQDSLSTVIKLQEENAKVINELGPAIKGKTKKKVDKQNTKNESKSQKKLDEAVQKSKSKFDILSQGAQGFSNQLDKVSDAAGHLSSAFDNVGDGMKSFGEVRNVGNDFIRMISSVGAPVAALGAAMAMATKAIGMYHDQLNISREMGSSSGNLVSDLQNMHINSLIDPAGLKALSDSLQTTFNVSLNNNRVEMEKVAVKQRLSERTMGKEYAENQMEALNSLKTVLEGQSPAGMMDDLAAQTSALAKTMGVSNKYALEQIKAIHENSKLITKGMNADIAKEIEKTMGGMASGMKQAGFSEEYIKATLEKVSNIAADPEAIADSIKDMNMMNQMGGKGADFLKQGLDTIGMNQKEANDLAAKASLVGFEGLSEKDKKLFLQMQQVNVQAQQVMYADLAKKVNDGTATASEKAKFQMLQQSKEWAKDSEVANKINQQGVAATIAAQKEGTKEFIARSKGEKSTADLDKLLVSMGATNKDGYNKMLDQLIANDQNAEETKKQMMLISKMSESQLAELKKNDPKKYAEYQRDAFKISNADLIKEQIKLAKDGKKLTMSGLTKKDGSALTHNDVKKTIEDPNYLQNQIKANSTGVENTRDRVEQKATAALYAFQNKTMELVNDVLPYLNKALSFLTENIETISMVMGGLFLAKLLKSSGAFDLIDNTISKLGSGIMKTANLIGIAGWNVTKGIAIGIGKFTKSLMNFPNTLKTIASNIGSATKKTIGFIGKAGKGAVSGLSNIFGGFKESLSAGFGKIKDVFSNVGLSIGNTFKNIKTSFAKGKDTNNAATVLEPDGNFWQKAGKKWTGFKKTVSGGLKTLGGGLKSMMGPAFLAGAAMKALQGGMEGWGKAAEWFGKDLEPQKKLLTKNTKEGKKYAESLSKTGKAVFVNGQWEDEYGNKLEARASLTQKSASAVGGALEALSFGMLDGQVVAHKVAEAFSWLGKKMDEMGITATFNELGNALGAFFSKIGEVVGWIFNKIQPLLSVVGDVFKGIFKYINGFFQIITGIFTGNFSKIGEGIKTIFDGFLDIITIPLKAVLGMVDSIFGTDMLGTFRNSFTAIKNIFGTFYELITAPFKSIMSFFKGEISFDTMVKDIFTNVKNAIIGALNGIVDLVRKPFDWVFGLVDDYFGTKFTAVFNSFIDAIKGYFNNIVNAVSGILGGFIDIVKAPFLAISAWISGDLSFIDAVKQIFDGVKNGVISLFNGFTDLVTAPFKFIIDYVDGIFGTDIKATFQGIVDGVKNIFSGFIDLVTAPFKAVVAYFTDPDMSLLDMFKNMFNGIVDAGKKIFSGLYDVVTKPISDAINWLLGMIPGMGPDSEEEKSSADLEKKGYWVDDYGYNTLNTTKVQEGLNSGEIGLKELKAMRSESGLEGKYEDELDRLIKALENGADAKTIKVEAKAKGGYTGDAANKALTQLIDPTGSAEPNGIAGVHGPGEFVIPANTVESFYKLLDFSTSNNKKTTKKESKKTETNVFSKITESIKGFISTPVDSVKGAVSNAYDKIIPNKSSETSNKLTEIKERNNQKEIISKQKQIADEQVKKTTKEGIDDKQANAMVNSLDDVKNILKDKLGVLATGLGATATSFFGGQVDIGKSVVDGITNIFTGKSTITEALTNIGGTASQSLQNLAQNVTSLLPTSVQNIVQNVGSSIKEVGTSLNTNIAGVLNGDTSIGEALTNVTSSLTNVLPNTLTNALGGITSSLSSAGDLVSTNIAGVLNGDTSIGEALTNVTSSLTSNLSNTFTSFTVEGGPLDSVMDAFDGDGSITETFNSITGSMGEGLTDALGSFDFGGIMDGLSGALGGLLGGGESGGGLLGGISSAANSLFGGESGGIGGAVSSVASSVGDFFGFAEGGKTPSTPDPVLETLTGMKGAAGIVHTNEKVIPESLVSIFDQLVMNSSSSETSKPTSGIISGTGTSGISTSPKLNNVSTQNYNSSSSSTTINNENAETTTLVNVEKLLEQMLQVQNQQLGHLNNTSKEFTKQNKIAQKSYKRDVDSSDNIRQRDISKAQYR